MNVILFLLSTLPCGWRVSFDEYVDNRHNDTMYVDAQDITDYVWINTSNYDDIRNIHVHPVWEDFHF